MEIVTGFAGPVLHCAEAAPEFLIGPSERLFAIDAHPLGETRDGEQHIAELILLLLRSLRERKLADLLSELLEWAANVRPIESASAGAALQRLRFG